MQCKFCGENSGSATTHTTASRCVNALKTRLGQTQHKIELAEERRVRMWELSQQRDTFVVAVRKLVDVVTAVNDYPELHLNQAFLEVTTLLPGLEALVRPNFTQVAGNFSESEDQLRVNDTTNNNSTSIPLNVAAT